MSAEFIEQIEAYLKGNMSRETLENIAKDQGISNLDEEIEWYENSITAIQAVGLRNQLKEILPKAEKKEAQVRSLPNRRWLIGIAASFLLIVLAYFGFVKNNQHSLYAQYEFIDPGLPVLMSQSEDHQLYDAMSYYSEGNYSVAEEKLLQLQEDFGSNDTISYFLGASRLYQGKTALAQAPLIQVAGEFSSRFQQKAEWLMVLAALQSKNQEEAKRLLEVILKDTGHDFYKKAQDLQKELSQ